MRGDFSRDTFDPFKHFSRVLQQQGRVHLDADWNEQTAILMHYLRTLAADLIGPFAGPAGTGSGFKIGEVDDGVFAIGAGRYYVDGILCENDDAATRSDSQENFPSAVDLEKGTTYLVYLDVWERHISAVEDDDIREKALGGPDTATRTKVVWQVKVDKLRTANPTPASVRKNWLSFVEQWQSGLAGCLRARVERPESSTDPCLTAPDARYRGAENQLYRIEIHRGGPAGEATFKWSRNNGAVSTRATLTGTDLIAANPQGFSAGSWVELTSDAQELRGDPGTLVRLLRVDGDRLTLDEGIATPGALPQGERWPTKARSWDQRKTGSAPLEKGAVRVSESVDEKGWIPIENGIQIQFLPGSSGGGQKHVYRTSDFWLIPARVGTGDIEWPLTDGDRSRPRPRPPHGVRHHYAPLAVLESKAAGWTVHDCRCEFSPLENSCGAPPLLSRGDEGIGAAKACLAPEDHE